MKQFKVECEWCCLLLGLNGGFQVKCNLYNAAKLHITDIFFLGVMCLISITEDKNKTFYCVTEVYSIKYNNQCSVMS